ncbi:8-oxo-dGTP diphosphatase [Paenibacillus sp. UNCCL117]|uniref:NUDIX hydrolase n=1 Tax=unclassified Paenibacillus TaxID=185978 RepID=UPI00088410AB|nr:MULTISPECIES: NUDIX domain-containing protein [unclassified Paenibacillus]SDE29116.1 8-oxo-dGTP diphosphatase [Paenibacillus sp. cl123]SFW63335.1 8-oxo-dGTP diphosphatase [Paenibacillus sp. UNCCL117]
MQGYNVLMIYNKNMDRLLMCKRLKNPYQGLNNFVGGKIEIGESGMEAAYRELLEETSISKEHIVLHHLMDFTYYIQHCYVEVYAGRLKDEVEVSGDENDLYWSDLNQNFFDMTVFAGEGSIGHMIEQVKMNPGIFLADETLPA